MRFVCIHAHFYQPPRENPWLEAIELQDSAYPYHDWNERITAECYAPNLAARILDSKQRIARIANNYASLSFNVGPTLLSWMAEKSRGVYDGILEADVLSAERFSGHGSAMAQCYNHIIMPLANARDKRTQIQWGIADFKMRFARMPEGMWLPETAVDLETLDMLAEEGILFTVLTPYQARAFRPAGDGPWSDVDGGRIDTTRAYRVQTAPGRSIAVFFYDGPTSRAVAFEHLLNDGAKFADRIVSTFSNRGGAQLAHIATDGETYGHHHRYGEMALAYALEQIESRGLAKITNYGEFLALYPPQHEATIHENTSWSCAHGVGRWNSDCGCNSGAHPGYDQAWRAPLRAAFDALRDELAPLYEARGAALFHDPWEARNAYVDVVLDRSPESLRRFAAKHFLAPLAPLETVEAWKLLELQRHAMLMYTSCGWFFDEVSGIETVQVIEYAARAVQLAQEIFGDSIEQRFLHSLKAASSNVAEHVDAAEIYERQVLPAMLDLTRLGAHYAMSSLFERYSCQLRVYAYTVERLSGKLLQSGKLKLVLGQARFTSSITQETEVLAYAALHLGDHNIRAKVCTHCRGEALDRLSVDIEDAFSRADLAEVLRLMDHNLSSHPYSLKSLFKDEQRDILDVVLHSAVEDAERAHSQVYAQHAPLMRFLAGLGTPAPKAVQAAAEYALNSRLRRALAEEFPELAKIHRLLDECHDTGVELDTTTLEFAVRRNLERMSETLSAQPAEASSLARLKDAVHMARSLPFPVVFWTVQNRCYRLLQQVGAGGDQDPVWLGHLQALAEDLSLRIPM